MNNYSNNCKHTWILTTNYINYCLKCGNSILDYEIDAKKYKTMKTINGKPNQDNINLIYRKSTL